MQVIKPLRRNNQNIAENFLVAKWPMTTWSFVTATAKLVVGIVRFMFAQEFFAYHWSLNRLIFRLRKSPYHRIKFISSMACSMCLAWCLQNNYTKFITHRKFKLSSSSEISKISYTYVYNTSPTLLYKLLQKIRSGGGTQNMRIPTKLL